MKWETWEGRVSMTSKWSSRKGFSQKWNGQRSKLIRHFIILAWHYCESNLSLFSPMLRSEDLELRDNLAFENLPRCSAVGYPVPCDQIPNTHQFSHILFADNQKLSINSSSQRKNTTCSANNWTVCLVNWLNNILINQDPNIPD